MAERALHGTTLDVMALPRRQAHAMHALFEASAQLRMPPTAEEVCHYDEEAVSVKATAAALREASRRGLCACAQGVWFATGPALVIGARPFERRFFADIEESGDA